MSDQEFHPQDETPETKTNDNEKFEENFEKEGKRHNGDSLSALAWALILIWAGMVFLASNMGWLNQIQAQQFLPEELQFIGLSTWSVIFLGAGGIVFLEAMIRTLAPAYRSSSSGNFFLAAILLGVGLGGIFGWRLVWPFVLIAMGLSALANALIQQRK